MSSRSTSAQAAAQPGVKKKGAREWLEWLMNLIFFLCGAVAVAFVLFISIYLIISGLPAIREIGLIDFLFGDRWASTAAEPEFGILPFILTSIYGTAGAISSIAFGIPEPAVDGNVLRVVARITGDDGDIMKPDTKARMGAALKRVMPVDAPGDFNQALMELGATVCLPNGAPLCDQCPARDFCVARLTERTGELPVKAAKKARRVEERTVFLIFRDGAVALRRRKSRGLLAGLWEYPNELSPAPCPVEALSLEQGPSGKHIFTHIEWRMKAVLVQAAGDTLPEGWVWATLEEVDRDYAVPNAFQAFKPAVEGRLKGEGEEPWQSCISGME